MADAVGYTEDRELHYEKKRGGQIEHSDKMRFAIALVEEGEGRISLRTRHYRFGAGDVLVMPEGSDSTIDCGEEARITLITFKPYFLSPQLRGALRWAAPVIRRAGGAVVDELLTKMSSEIRRADAISRDLCRAYVTELCAEVIRAEAESAEAEQVCPAVELVLAYVAEHSGERISLSDMARLGGVSAAYLSRRFKDEVGVGFADYVATFRLERAQAMLRERPDMSVTEIAFLCGFNDSNYFSDKFKKHFGLSPIKFRKER